MRIQIGSGQEPAECKRAVRLFAKEIKESLMGGKSSFYNDLNVQCKCNR